MIKVKTLLWMENGQMLYPDMYLIAERDVRG
jgi:hypothetical protein